MMACQMKLHNGSPVENIRPQQGLASNRAGGVLPVHEEHEDHAENGGEQGHPLVVKLRRSVVSQDALLSIMSTLNAGLQLGALV